MAGPSDNAFPSEQSWPGEWPPVYDGPSTVAVLPHTTTVVVQPHTTRVVLVTFDVPEGS